MFRYAHIEVDDKNKSMSVRIEIIECRNKLRKRIIDVFCVDKNKSLIVKNDFEKKTILRMSSEFDDHHLVQTSDSSLKWYSILYRFNLIINNENALMLSFWKKNSIGMAQVFACLWQQAIQSILVRWMNHLSNVLKFIHKKSISLLRVRHTKLKYGLLSVHRIHERVISWCLCLTDESRSLSQQETSMWPMNGTLWDNKKRWCSSRCPLCPK